MLGVGPSHFAPAFAGSWEPCFLSSPTLATSASQKVRGRVLVPLLDRSCPGRSQLLSVPEAAFATPGYLEESPLRIPIWENLKGVLSRVYTGIVPSIPL